jgi:cobalt-zinc-cadmium efflux system outer membrane protein
VALGRKSSIVNQLNYFPMLRTRSILLAISVAVASWTSPARGEGPPLIAPTYSVPQLVLSADEPIPSPPLDAPAQDQRLTRSAVESLAASRHPALREAEGQLRAARGNWVQVGLRPNPEIGYSGMEIGDEGQAGQQGGYFSQEFVTAGKLGLNRAVADREVAAAEQRYYLTRLQVLTSVRINYFEVLAAERAVDLATRLRAIAAQSVKVSDLRLQAMEGSRAALLQSQIESESAQMLEEQAANRRVAAWRRLAALIGMDGDSPQRLEDTLLEPLPELDWNAELARILTESPELAALRNNVERARWAVARARAGRVPNVDVQAGVAQDDATDDTIASVQVSMPVPIFDRNQGAILQACGQLTAAEAALERRELLLRQQLAEALRDYATARQRVARYSDAILPTARQSLEMINRAYEQGELDFLQLLSIQQTYTQKNLAYLEDLEIAWKKWAEIDGLLVGPLPENDD